MTACLIGAAINAAQGKDIFFSAVPYVIPLLVQGFAKASLKFKIKDIDLLCQLPAERKDPAFVSDQKGRIIFLNVTNEPAGKLNVVVGDVSGHGIAAGLLMATARALIRSRSAQPGSLSEIVTEVNRNLTLDIQETNRFMTLFYLTIDPANKSLSWVRAGHDAALVYNPSTDGFEELFGPGMALGLDENYQYEENELANLVKGELIFLGTDGIWETRNPDGRLFGKRAVQDILRQNAAASAGEILDKILFALSRFRGSLEPEDDVTLVVVKIEEDA